MADPRITYRITRELTINESLYAAYGVEVGSIVHEYHGPMFGGIDTPPWAIAVSWNPTDNPPFFEVPRNAVEPITAAAPALPGLGLNDHAA